MVAKCRQHHSGWGPAGSANGRSVLNDAKVRAIKALLASGWKAAVLAREYGVGGSTVYNIKYGNNWRHIEPSNFEYKGREHDSI
jgi:hypothetical protein